MSSKKKITIRNNETGSEDNMHEWQWFLYCYAWMIFGAILAVWALWPFIEVK